jgi:ABC-type Na+ transport system ATPase subunit NatA
MAELQELADDVIFLADGRVRFSGSVSEMMTLTQQVSLERAVAEMMDREKAA